MGRENHDPTVVVHSSIALLQERFRQLQRVKEMREERELQKMLTEPKQFNSISNITTSSTPTYESSRLFSNPELIMPSRSPDSPPHVSLSLWPTSQDTSFKTPVSMNLCTTNYTHHAHTQSLQTSWKNGYDCDSGSDSGVDTSLHL